MLFSSQVLILAFLPPVLCCYYALHANRVARQGFVIAASLVFYAYWDVRFVPLLVGLSLATWLVALAYGRWRYAAIPVVGVAINLATLGVFKYADFFAGSVSAAMGRGWSPLNIVLPLGISFFVFQKISYLIDLRRGNAKVYPILDFFMFTTFFPQLIAGPLVRHNEIIPQFGLDPCRPGLWENLSRGAILFTIGLAEKVALADSLSPDADTLFLKAASLPLNGAEAWAATGGYTLQIFFDFAGYSDMAIGLARMFGLTLPSNFNMPYRSVSVRDFWRRWHMTLSRFLRDYVYIPLGGNRCGPVRRAFNVMATMLLGGLWHGANWTFVAWGGLHGAALALDQATAERGWRLPRPLTWLATLLFVIAAWVLFRAPTFATATRVYAGLVGANGLGSVTFQNGWALAAGAAIALFAPTGERLAAGFRVPHAGIAVAAGLALVFLLLLTGGRLQTAFVYFQF